MSTKVYPIHTHPATLCTVDDMIAYVLPKVTHYVEKHYFDCSYDVQQEFIQAGIVTLWEEVRRGKLAPTDPPGYWMTTCKTGIVRAFEDLERETGVRVKRQGRSFIEHRIDYDSDLAFDDSESTGLEIAERTTHRAPGPADPEGGRLDQHIDFEWLLTRAFSRLKTADVEDCAAVALHLAAGEETGVDFCALRGWSKDRYYAALDRLKDAFYATAGQQRPAKQKGAASLDPKKVVALYQEGYGHVRIARLLGCSKSRVGQIVQQVERKQGKLPRSSQRAYHPTKPMSNMAHTSSIVL